MRPGALAAIAGIIVRGQSVGRVTAARDLRSRVPGGGPAVSVNPHVPLDSTLLCNLSGPYCLCTMFTNYEDNHANELGAHKLAKTSCSLCACAYL